MSDSMDYLDELLNLVPKRKHKLAFRYVNELRWMDEKLESARRAIAGSAVVIPYDNGGGQTGVRANPAYGEYEKLLKTWDKTMQSFISLVPKDAIDVMESLERPSNAITDMQRRFSVVNGNRKAV